MADRDRPIITITEHVERIRSERLPRPGAFHVRDWHGYLLERAPRAYYATTGQFAVFVMQPQLEPGTWEAGASGPKALAHAEAASLFSRLAAEWRESRAAHKTTTRNFMLPAYQMIIGMGPAALPLILKELEREPDHWFWALKAISRHDPVPAEAVGDIHRMGAHWLEWGRRSGLV